VVERDRGGECQEPERDACCDAGDGAGAVAFERELAFAGLEDRLDPLAQGTERSEAGCFVLAARASDPRAEVGRLAFEVAAGVALVADDGDRPVVFDALKEPEADLALTFGFASASALGVPSGANRPCSRKPQKNQEWLAQ